MGTAHFRTAQSPEEEFHGMNDSAFIIAVVIVAVGAILGIAYSLEARIRRRGTLGRPLPPLNRTGRRLWWVARVLVALMVLSMVIAFVYRSLPFVWLAAACLLLYILEGLLYRLVLQRRK
jgi:hypothetical protein